MAAAFHKGIVRIEVGAKARGTGFIVRAEAGAIDILTALHVVADLKASRASGTPVWHGASATVQLGSGEKFTVTLGAQGSRSSTDQDWALLRFEGVSPGPVAPLRLASLEPRTYARKWNTFGYSDAAPDAGEPHSGDIEDEKGNIIYLFDKQGAAGTGGFLSGCSGAPCIVEGHVVGIIVEALQRQEKGKEKEKGKAQSVHGAVFALRIEVVAQACGLKLADGRQVFEEEVVQALANVRGPSLMKLAKALDVPAMESEDSLRIWVARALLVADEKKFRLALGDCIGSVLNPILVAEMILARAIKAEGAQAVRQCFDQGVPKGVATLAKGELLMRLLAARAFEGFGRVRNHFKFVDSRVRSQEAWAARIRDALLGLLGLSPEDVEDDAALDEHLEDWGGALVALPFDPHVNPLDEVERYQRVRPLAMVSQDQAATFQREGYEFSPALEETFTEQMLDEAMSRVSRYFRMKTQE